MQSSIYNMNLTNEIHFDPVNFVEVNSGPNAALWQRNCCSLRVNDACCCAAVSPTPPAVFREGLFAGNDVPLVSRYTHLPASAGISGKNISSPMRRCVTGAAVAWTTIRQHPRAHPGQRNSRLQAERGI